MPEDNTQHLSDPLDTKPLIEQLAREMVATREMLLEQFQGVKATLSEHSDRLSAIEKEIRLLGRKMDVFADDLTRARVEVRDLEVRVTEIERKPA